MFVVLNVLDTLCIFMSRLHDAVCVRFAIFQPDDYHRLFPKFRYSGHVGHVETGNC